MAGALEAGFLSAALGGIFAFVGNARVFLLWKGGRKGREASRVRNDKELELDSGWRWKLRAVVDSLGGGLGFCSWTRRLVSGLLIAGGSCLRSTEARHGRACVCMSLVADLVGGGSKWGIWYAGVGDRVCIATSPYVACTGSHIGLFYLLSSSDVAR